MVANPARGQLNMAYVFFSGPSQRLINWYCDTDTAVQSRVQEKSNASKPSEHPPSGENLSKGLGGNIGCGDKNSSWYQKGSPM